MSHALTVRDLEVLRSLLRLQVATTAALSWAFFTQLKLAQRRLRTLRERGLITAHERGICSPLAAGSRYWRLTATGLAVVVEAFPQELVPNNALERAAGASLRNFEHRNAIADLYLALVVDGDKNPSESRRRADLLCWRGEFDIELGYQARTGAQRVGARVIPDATLETETTRFFLEIDRSTESRTRCRRALRGYGRHVQQGRYAAQFGADRAPYVVYVTKSDGRRESLQLMVQELKLPFSVVVLSATQAPAWLAAAVFGADGPDIATPCGISPPARDAVRALYDLALEGVELRRAIGDDDGAAMTSARLAKVFGLLRQEGAMNAGS